MHRRLLATGHVHHRHRSMASVASVSGTTTARMVDFSSGNGALAIIDFYGASPLHYAIMALEENNIQALLSLGANINQQDNSGSSMLHVAIVRYIED